MATPAANRPTPPRVKRLVFMFLEFYVNKWDNEPIYSGPFPPQTPHGPTAQKRPRMVQQPPSKTQRHRPPRPEAGPSTALQPNQKITDPRPPHSNHLLTRHQQIHQQPPAKILRHIPDRLTIEQPLPVHSIEGRTDDLLHLLQRLIDRIILLRKRHHRKPFFFEKEI